MTAKPKLLMLMQLPPPVHGSAVSNQQMWESKQLHEAFDLTLMRVDFARSVTDIGQFRPFKMRRAVALFRQLHQALSAQKYDAVYITLSPVGLAFLRDAVLMGLVRYHRVKRIYHMRGKGIAAACKRSFMWKMLYRLVFKGAKVIHLSARLLPDIAQVYDSSQVVIVPNGRPDPGQEWIAPLRETEVPTLLFLSNMTETKGAGVLLEALGVLKERDVSFKAVFAGPWKSSVFRDIFETAVKALKLEACVSYIGPVYDEAKLRTFQAADIFVFPTFFECFPGVLLEALSQGLPVVSTLEGGIPDIVADGETGILVPPRRPDRLAISLEILLKDPALRRRYGEASRKRYEALYTLPLCEAAMVQALRKCL